MEFSFFTDAAAIMAVTIAIGILSVASCTLLNNLLPQIFTPVPEDHEGPEAEFLIETDQMESLRRDVVSYPNGIRKGGLAAVMVFSLPLLLIVGFELVTGFDIADMPSYLGQQGYAQLINGVPVVIVVALAAPAAFSIFILNRVVGAKATYASAVYTQ